MVRSEVLRNAHPVFKTGLDANWSHNKIIDSSIYGTSIKYMYELELEPNGEDILIGKVSFARYAVSMSKRLTVLDHANTSE